MKRLIMGVVAALLMLPVSAQDTTSLTAKQVYEDVKDGFSKLVTTLEGPAKHTYVTYVRQHKITGVTSMVITVFCLAIFSTLFGMGIKKSKETEDIWENTGYVSGFFLICTIIAIVATMSTTITKIWNPEYYAIKDIVDAFK